MAPGVHRKILFGWFCVAIFGVSAFIVARSYAISNKKTEMEIRRKIRKQVDQELAERELERFR